MEPEATATRSDLPDSVVALMSNLIDYAGLFPPANLDMATTVANYASFLEGPDAWMLERLIVPVKRLDELEACVAGRLPSGSSGGGAPESADPEATAAEDEPWPISALTTLESLENDLARIDAFNRKHEDPEAGRAVIDVIELRAESIAAIERTIESLPDDVFPFFELPVGGDLRGLVTALAGGDAGAKIRTGGVTPDLYPARPDVARFINLCAAADVPFKATAGLHHPLGGHREAARTKELGFLNVFVAAVLALYDDLEDDEVLRVLDAETLDGFTLDDDTLAFEGYRVTTDQVEDARLTFAVSFGSCSFDEPRDDLRSLGLL